MSNEELLQHTRELRDKLRPQAAHLREMGIEADPFLEDCDRLIAFLEGRSEEWVDVAQFLEKLTAFGNEMREFAEIQRQAQRINTDQHGSTRSPRFRVCLMRWRIWPVA